MGISAMMHGYLAFDKDWNLLTPFRTWQNTMTGEEAAELTELFGFNIPQRWSIAHLWHAIRTGEAHVGKLAHITTLAGYFHYMLTGVNAVGIGEASGMFPIDSETLDYDRGMMEKFDRLIAEQPFTLRDLLPQVLPAGVPAGKLTAAGAARLRRYVHLLHGRSGASAAEGLSGDRSCHHADGPPCRHGALQQLYERHERLGRRPARDGRAVRQLRRHGRAVHEALPQEP